MYIPICILGGYYSIPSATKYRQAKLLEKFKESCRGILYRGGNIQFQVPQNIDLEDKIVGPLTLTQFLYVLGGGLLDYILFQSLGKDNFTLFIIIGAPIALLAAGLAFFKVQDQPLSHFVTAGLAYLSKPKIRLWQRVQNYRPILVNPPKIEKPAEAIASRHVDKSQLEQLAYALDTSVVGPKEQAKQPKFGQITEAFEKLLREQPAPKAQTKKQ